MTCTTCRFFDPATAPSDAGPGDPPSCNWVPPVDYPVWVDVGHWLSAVDLAEADGGCLAWQRNP